MDSVRDIRFDVILTKYTANESNPYTLLHGGSGAQLCQLNGPQPRPQQTEPTASCTWRRSKSQLPSPSASHTRKIWQKWIRRYEQFRIASGIASREEEAQVNTRWEIRPMTYFVPSLCQRKTERTLRPSSTTTSSSDATQSSSAPSSIARSRMKASRSRRSSQLSTRSRSTADMAISMTK